MDRQQIDREIEALRARLEEAEENLAKARKWRDAVYADRSFHRRRCRR